MAQDDDARALLGLLLDEPAVHFSQGELSVQLGWDPVRVEDTVAELVREGLAHRHEGFAFASRVALRGRQLDL